MNVNDVHNARGKNDRILEKKNEKYTVMILFSSLRQHLIEMYEYIGT
jgi:hypothetical protein